MTETQLRSPAADPPSWRGKGWTVAEIARRWGYSWEWAHLLATRKEGGSLVRAALLGLPQLDVNKSEISTIAQQIRLSKFQQDDSPWQVKQKLKALGWRSVELAAYFDLSIYELSRRINAAPRSAMFTDALNGLPDKVRVVVNLQPRHLRRSPKLSLLPPELFFAKGDRLIAENSRFGEEGDEWLVLSSSGRGLSVEVCMQRVSDHEIQTLSVSDVVISFAHVAN
jgi:hypothetical protein